MTLTTLDGRYHVVERVASGGMGEVYRAHDAVLAREVAIKVLHRSLAGDPGFVERFRREARAAAGLTHPNIVAVYDWGAVEGIYFMIMQFVRGASLREILNANGRLEPAQAADVLLQVLSALEHAHRQGIVHRDMKPENVIVDHEGRALVADFGLARAYADARATQVGTVTGTAQYLAPEQIRGEPADPRSDLYSLGVLAYEVLTGRLPFSGETAMAIAYKHLSERVPPPSKAAPGISKGLDGWVLSATERDRELRPESAAEMRRDLQNEERSLPPARPIGELVEAARGPLPDGQGPEHAETITIPRKEKKREERRRTGRRVLGALVAILALAGAAWAAWTFAIPHSVTVPQLVGTPVDEARARLIDLGLTVRMGEGEFSLDVRAGHVVSVDPVADTELEEGAKVTLVSSLGPRPIEIPRLTGMTRKKADETLGSVGLLLGEVRREFHETIREGRVTRQKPAPSKGTAPEGSEIDVWMSKGPPPVEVPTVTDLSEGAALTALTALDLEGRIRREFSNRIDEGYVISQEPKAEDVVDQGTGVTIVVSKGPEAFPVDTYIGLSEAAAVAAVEADGLVPRVQQVPSGVSGTVVGQSPEPGTTVRAGDTITIFVA
ncbi:MAG TPA: Stk1 family PASTA domain-containing Ser/Thr kinase [Actinomycetota bacterium]|nr:Stk1 family PASTA domain-containing Ser/Thr kinase [Actinomycetota bacterium]